MDTYETIYVAVLDEGADAWRPMRAKKIGENIYSIEGNNLTMDKDIESREFDDGDIVVVEDILSSAGMIKVAKKIYKEI